MIMIEDQIEIEDPLKEEDIQVRMEDHLIEGGIPIGIEGLLEEEDILEEDPLMEEDPLDGGGPPDGNGGPPGPPGGQGPHCKDLLDQ